MSYGSIGVTALKPARPQGGPVGGTSTWTCEFCRKKYHRSDVLRRHYLSCPQRGQRKVPVASTRGRRKKACDICARRKVSCDLDLPCENFLLSGNRCTYRKTATDQGRSSLDAHREVLLEISLDAHKVSIPFLLNWTNPNSHLTDTFQPSTDIIVHSSTVQNQGTGDTHGLLPHSPDDGTSSSDLGFSANPTALAFLPHEFNLFDEFSPSLFLPLHSTQLRSQFDTLVEQVGTDSLFDDGLTQRNIPAEFADHLTSLTLSLPRDHPEHAPSLNLALGMTAFTQDNIQMFIRLYFHHWNRHSPILHRGTFDVATASLPVLLVVTLTGALFSVCPNDHSAARSMLNIAEEFAFHDPDFLKIASGIFPDGLHQRRGAIQALQAAFSIAQLQLREGCASKRTEVRSKRFDQIIYAVRTMALQSTKNTQLDSRVDEGTNCDWNDFCEKESCVRLVYGIFNLDVAFTIFYNMPPRLFNHELQIGMPCSLDAYMAETATLCWDAVSSEKRSLRSSFPEVVMAFARDGMDSVQGNPDFSPLYLFPILLGFVQIIWSSKRQSSSFDCMQRLRSGLQLWKSKWDLTMSQMTPRQKHGSGFIIYAGPEFWHLANYLITLKGDTLCNPFEGDLESRPDGTGMFAQLLQMARTVG